MASCPGKSLACFLLNLMRDFGAAPFGFPIRTPPPHTKTSRLGEALMAKTVADVMNMVKESEAKFVDFRFTDTRGKEQHVSVPIFRQRRGSAPCTAVRARTGARGHAVINESIAATERLWAERSVGSSAACVPITPGSRRGYASCVPSHRWHATA